MGRREQYNGGTQLSWEDIKVKSVTHGAVNSEIVIELPGGQTHPAFKLSPSVSKPKPKPESRQLLLWDETNLVDDDQ